MIAKIKQKVYLFDENNHSDIPNRAGHRYVYYNKKGEPTSVTPVYKIHDVTPEELEEYKSLGEPVMKTPPGMPKESEVLLEEDVTLEERSMIAMSNRIMAMIDIYTLPVTKDEQFSIRIFGSKFSGDLDEKQSDEFMEIIRQLALIAKRYR